MSSYFNIESFKDNLLGKANSLISHPDLVTYNDLNIPDEENLYNILQGSGKPKAKSKDKVKSKDKTKPKDKVKPKVKLIDTFLKKDLEKIAKKNDISLKMRDGKLKTKEQLFSSLKRKKLV